MPRIALTHGPAYGDRPLASIALMHRRGGRRTRLILWCAMFAGLAASTSAGRLRAHSRLTRDFFEWGTVIFELIAYGILAESRCSRRGLSRREAFALRRPRSWARGSRLMVQSAAVARVSVALVAVLGRRARAAATGLPRSIANPQLLANIAASHSSVRVEESLSRGIGFTLSERSAPRSAVVITGIAFASGTAWSGTCPRSSFSDRLFVHPRRTGTLYPSLILRARTAWR